MASLCRADAPHGLVHSGSRARAAPEGSQGKSCISRHSLCDDPLRRAICRNGTAFDHGCGRGGRAVACYDKVRLPDVYATNAPVLLRPAFSQVLRTRPVVGVRSSASTLRRSLDRLHRRPSTASGERVSVPPRALRREPAVTRTVRESVVVQAARVAGSTAAASLAMANVCARSWFPPKPARSSARSSSLRRAGSRNHPRRL